MDLRNDSRVMRNVLSSFGNPFTGLGTDRDKTGYLEIKRRYRIPQETLSALASKGVLNTLITIYPIDAAASWYKLDLDKDSKVDPQEIYDYHDRIPDSDFDEGEEGIGLSKYFEKASVNARQNGDALILIGINDNRSPDQPVDINNIKSIDWLKILDFWDYHPLNYYDNPDNPKYYSIPGTGIDGYKWHRSRVMRFTGKELTSNSLKYLDGKHQSVIDSVIESWWKLEQALLNVNGLVANHQFRILGMKGLSRLLMSDTNGDIEKKILDRLLTLDMGISSLKTVVIDSDSEELSNLNISYNGIDKIIEKLQDNFIADIDIPKSILLNEIGSKAFQSGEAYKMIMRDWAYRIQSWQNQHWRDNLEKIIRYIFLAKDSPTKGKIPDYWRVDFPLNVRETEFETAERRGKELDNEKKQAEINLIKEQNPQLLKTDSFPYVKKVLDINGYKFGLEYLAGDTRFSKKLKAHYGYLKDEDGESLDAYIKPLEDFTTVKSLYAIRQLDFDGDFDETKLAIGFDTGLEVELMYKSHMPEKLFGGIVAIDWEDLEEFRKDAHHHKGKLINDACLVPARSSSGKFAGCLVGGGSGGSTVSGKQSTAKNKREAYEKVADRPESELKKLKVTELKDVASGIEAEPPTKYRNRKDPWIASIKNKRAIDKGQSKPKPTPGTETAKKVKTKRKAKTTATKNRSKTELQEFANQSETQLKSLKVSDLKAIAEAVEADAPAKYRNRKDPWIASIKKKTGNDKPTPKPIPKPTPTPKKSRIPLGDNPREYIDYGKEFADKYGLDPGEPSQLELRLFNEKNQIGEKLSRIKDTNSREFVKNRREFLRKERAYEIQKFKREQKTYDEFERLRKDLLNSPTSRKQAEEYTKKLRIDSLEIDESIKKDLTESFIEFHQLTNGRARNAINNFEYDPNGRAHTNTYTGLIVSHAEKRVIYHESAHNLEFVGKGLEDAANNFKKEKAENLTPKRLRDITGNRNYNENEIAYVDKYITPYVGKIYPTGGTEVISVGMEYFVSRTKLKELREKDPEHFNFMLGVIRRTHESDE